MNRTRSTAALLLAAATLAGCGDVAPDGAGPGTAATSLRGERSFDAALERDGCEALTAGIVAAAAGVDASELQQVSIGGACSYSWTGGDVTLMGVTVREDAAAAREHFAAAYRTMTPEEGADADVALQAQLARQVEAGSLTADQAAMAGRIGAMASEAAVRRRLERIEGIGEQAVYDATPHTTTVPYLGQVTSVESQLAVQLGNVVFDVRAHLQDPDRSAAEARAGPSDAEQARNRAVTLEIGRAIVARLNGMR
jgi:hypothetical protein